VNPDDVASLGAADREEKRADDRSGGYERQRCACDERSLSDEATVGVEAGTPRPRR